MYNDIRQSLKRYFGFDTFKGNQEEIIRSLLSGKDTFVLMPTGGGKSLCYQLPALMMPGVAIVVSPLIALMKNQVDAIRAQLNEKSVAHFLNSSLSRAAIDQVKDDVRNGRTRLLYVAPESLTKDVNIDFLHSVPISFYAIDEAHCISEWGHDFRPEYRRIRPLINAIGQRPVIALTATATPKVQHDIQKNLGMTNARIFKASFNRPNLYYEVRPKTRNIDREIIKFIKSNPGKSGIVYCLSRKKVEEFAQLLVLNNIKALPYHAGMDAQTRSENQDAFLLEKVDVIVATIAFGMGIDKPDVRFVVHYDMPKSLEGYYQETGRAGRDGGEGRCITFFSPRDIRKIEKFLQAKSLSEQEIGRQLLAETAAYAESSLCRRKSLLHYFGESYTEENCRCCDNCVNPHTRQDGTRVLGCILEAVERCDGSFRAEHILDILRGRTTADVKNYGHDSLEVFASCCDVENSTIATILRQATIEGMLARDIENFGLVSLTPAGKRQLRHPQPFMYVENIDFDPEADTAGPEGTAALDPQLYDILHGLRARIARRLSLPPYIVFQEQSLEAMATMYPVTQDELRNIPGVGVGKATRYGDEFLAVIKQYVDDNDIERPEDMRVRTIPNHSVKISLIQAIDRKIALDELAESKGMDFEQLLDELDAIIDSGTRIDISYYINDLLDDSLQDEIYTYLRSAETDSIEQAYSEFDGEYSVEELRLMRIKFISEMSN